MDTFHHLHLYPRTPLLLDRRLVVVENVVHLLQCPSHCLGDEEVHPDQGKQTESCKEDISPEADGRKHWRGNETLCGNISDERVIIYGFVLLQLTMMKLLPQFDMVACAQPLALIVEGNTSAGIAQGMGPLLLLVFESRRAEGFVKSTYHVAPKVSMKKSKKATEVQAAAECSGHLPL